MIETVALIIWYGFGLVGTALIWGCYRKRGVRSTLLRTFLGWSILPLGGVLTLVGWLDLQYGPFGNQTNE